jgi:hypothetical protein
MRSPCIAMALIVASCGLPASDICRADDAPLQPLERSVTVLDAAGGIHALQPKSSEAARVFVFISGECPISKSYMPALNRLVDNWKQTPGKATLRAIWADATTRPADVAKFSKDYELRFPVLLDRDGGLSRRFKPTHVPEAFVLDADGRMAYRGRIDDTYPDLGQRRQQPTKNDLADAVAALIEGKPIARPRTDPVGCVYETMPEGAASNLKVTYTRDIAPILFANCVVCHRQGEVAPFELLLYQDAAKRAKQIARVVDRRLMPPWMPAQSHGEFENQRTLTEREIAVFKAWADAGRAEGELGDLPPTPQFTTGWRLGKPDMILEMPGEFEIHAGGPDIFQNFVIRIDIPTDKLVAAADFIPGNPKVVHHSLLYLDATHIARKLDAATPELGYPSFGGPGFQPTGSIGGWSPGKMPRRLPDGLGRYVRKGSDLVMQIHYHPDGRPETDRSKVGVYFVDKPKGAAGAVWASAFSHDIPPGEKDYHVTASYTLTGDVRLLSIVPHMHLLGRSIRAVAVLPDGTQRELINVPHWNYNWQDEYFLAQPIKLPKGTRLDVEAVYDNSAENPLNPSNPPKEVTWGEGTTDEMLYCFFLVSAEKPGELGSIVRDALMHEIIGKSTVLKRHPAP